MRAMLASTCMVTCLLGVSAAVHAQSSLEELIAKGAKPVDAAELREALSGSEIAGPAFRGEELQWILNKDGSLGGWNLYGGTKYENSGNWSVNDKGQFCFRLTEASGDAACQDWFKLGSEYFVVRSGRALKRTVRRL